MYLLTSLAWGAALLPEATKASWIPRLRNVTPSGCAFTLGSSGSFDCPAGQLPDGQIRLNGSQAVSTFYLGPDGGIIDSNGFGCIVTDPPTTQIQCDQGAKPAEGFSIDVSNNLLYHGSPTFWACPATDTEYNIYVNPDFGQTKCFTINLKTSGCGTVISSTCPPLSTAWTTQTSTVTEDITQTVTVLVTSSALCNVSSVSNTQTPSWNSTSTAKCHKCTETTATPEVTEVSNADNNIGKRSDSSFDLVKYGKFDEALSRRAALSVRVNNPLYDWWTTTRSNRGSTQGGIKYAWNYKDTVSTFSFGPELDYYLGQSLWVASDFYFGCTVWAAVGSKTILMGHALQENGNGAQNVCVLDSAASTQKYILDQFNEEVVGYDIENLSDNCFQRFVWIMASQGSLGAGPRAFKQYFIDHDVPDYRINWLSYTPGATGEPNANSAIGLSLIKWTSNSADDGAIATLEVFFNSEIPRISLTYVVRGGKPVLQTVAPSVSQATTVGVAGTAAGS